MTQFGVTADKYFNNKTKMDSIFGAENICPVDMNAGYVAEKKDKYGMDPECGEYTEDNIRERFGLETPEEGESY